MINKMSVLFLISNQSSGGLGLSPQELGFVLGTIGVIALTFGMMSGRRLSSRWSLRALVLPMAALLIVPAIVYVTLSFWQPSNFYLISTCVFFEQAAYGIALSGYLALLRKLRNGNIAKSLMALSMMIACMLSGTIQIYSSYFHFFLVTLVGWLLTFAAAFLVWRSLADHTK
jgi:PAT family beta-lactamase induction signal transducer AmpG